jgi:RNA polymerase sigma-70 factor (ECF subfamily)
MGRTDEALLLELAARGSLDAAAELFERYWPVAWKTAFAVTGDRAAADDVAQDALQAAFGALDRFERGRPFEPWLKRIVVNRAIDELRRARRTAPELELVAAAAVAPELDSSIAAIGGAVARLDHDRRVVVVLRYWLDFSPSDIAALLQIPIGTVASRLNRALEQLRAELEESNVA